MVRGQGLCCWDSQEIVLGCSVIAIQSASPQMPPVSGFALSAWAKREQYKDPIVCIL